MKIVITGGLEHIGLDLMLKRWEFYFYLGIYGAFVCQGIIFFTFFPFPLILTLCATTFDILMVAFVIWAFIAPCPVSYWKLLLWPIAFWFGEDSKFSDWITS